MKEHIRQSNLIENIDSAREDAQSLKAWKWLIKQETIGRPELFHLHKLIVQNQAELFDFEKGNYRSVPVRVDGFYPPNALRVPELMEDWLHAPAFWPDHDPREQHIKFEKIHPFVDGNGRTGRMLMWWHEKKLGRKPTLIKFEEREEYYDWFQQKDATGSDVSTSERAHTDLSKASGRSSHE